MKISKDSISYLLPACVIAFLSGFLLTGCDLGGSSSSNTQEDFIQVMNTEAHGQVFVDEEGNALYYFTLDVTGESVCEGQCISSWPVFLTGQLRSSGEVDPADFSSITRTDGSDQTTYKGWPLYYYAGDESVGDIFGDGINGVWYVAKPHNSLMIATHQLVGADSVNYIIDANGNYVEGDGLTTYFTDSQGRTLYAFANDSANTNNYTNEDFSNDDTWPIFHLAIEELPSGMNSDDFGEITVHGSRQQLTYRGWPLYYFGQDAQRGETKGVSVPQPGIWPIVNANTPMAPQ